MRIFSLLLVTSLCLFPAAAQTGAPQPPAANRPQDAETKNARPAPKRAPRRPPLPKSHLALLYVRLPAVEFDQIPLRDALDWLAEEMQANLIVHWNKMAEAGIDEARPIHLRVRNLRLNQVLWLLLNQAAADETKLAYRASADLIVISTAAEFEENLVTQVYEVRDLTRNPRGLELVNVRSATTVAAQPPIVGPGAFRITPMLRQNEGVAIGYPRDWNDTARNNAFDRTGNAFTDPEETPERRAAQLIDAIVESIEPESWRINGGRGTIRFFEGRLVVRNTVFVQQKIGGYLMAREKP